MVEGHSKGVPAKVVGSVEYGSFGSTVEGHSTGVTIDRTPVSGLPTNTKGTVTGHATGVSIDRTPQKGYQGSNTPMSDRAVKQSQ